MLTAPFPHSLQTVFDQFSHEDPLYALRKRAWEQLRLPTRDSEQYRYIKLKKLYEQEFCLPESVEVPFVADSDHYLVFVNGQFQDDLSEYEGLEVLPLNEAIAAFGAYLSNRLSKSIKEEADPFALMNVALHSQGAFLYLPPKTVLDSPVHIINITNVEHPALIMPRIHLFAGAQAQCDFFTTHLHLSGSDYFQNSVIDISVEEGARVSLTQISEGHKGFVFDAVRAQLKRNSFLNCVSATNGSPCHRQDYRVALVGEGSEARLNGVWQLKESAEAHVNVVIEHQAPSCCSRQLFKGVLSDFSRSSFEGKIVVRKEAQKTDAFQLNNNLLLGEHAQAFSKPNLEVFADDVKASHGATIGQLREEELFYMAARGIDAKSAQKLLTTSFCREVFDCMPYPYIDGFQDAH